MTLKTRNPMRLLGTLAIATSIVFSNTAHGGFKSFCKSALDSIKPSGGSPSGRVYTSAEKYVISELVLKHQVLFSDPFKEVLLSLATLHTSNSTQLGSIKTLKAFRKRIVSEESLRRTVSMELWKRLLGHFYVPSKNGNTEHEADLATANKLGIKVAELHEIYDLIGRINGDLTLKESVLQIINDQLVKFSDVVINELRRTEIVNKVPLLKKGKFIGSTAASVVAGTVGGFLLFQNFFIAELGIGLPLVYFGYDKIKDTAGKVIFGMTSAEGFADKIVNTYDVSANSPKFLTPSNSTPITMDELKALTPTPDLSSSSSIAGFGLKLERGTELISGRLGVSNKDHFENNPRAFLQLTLNEVISEGSKGNLTTLTLNQKIVEHVSTYKSRLVDELSNIDQLGNDLNLIKTLFDSHINTLNAAREKYMTENGLSEGSENEIVVAMGERSLELAQYRTTLMQIDLVIQTHKQQIRLISKFLTELNNHLMTQLNSASVRDIQTADLQKLQEFYDFLSKN
jgi:hypothetical protein